MSDIVKHLRAGDPCREEDRCRVMNSASGCLCAMAADTIEGRRAESEALRDTIADLVKALKMAADTIEAHDPGNQYTETGWASQELLDAWVEINAALAKAKQP
jgi:hypothetical protein